ncbi:MAG: PAS-domain containing protein, partial [Rhodocyclaceae bacterium]|nr:PAS-domain containing protein [Rhodocyclaceae bacterium]
MQKIALPMPDRATAQQAVAAPITAPVPRAARGPRGLVLAGLVAALGLLLALCAWLLATELDQVRAHAQIDHLAHARAAQAQAEIDAAARLARYAGSSELAAPDARGAAAARRMLELDPALRAVTVLDTSGRPLWQEGAQDTHSLQQALAVWPHVLAAQRPLAAVFIAPRRPGPAGEARLLVLVRQAAGHPPVLFAFDALRLFGASLQAGRAGVNFDLADANGLALLGGAGSADAEHIASVPLGSPYGNWQLRVSATPSAQAGLHSDAPQWLAAATLLLYALLVAGVYELRARRLRRVRLERRDRLLRAQVAQRRHSERRLEDRERLLAALIARFPGGLILIDPEQQVAACNEAYKRMLDLPPELFAEVPLAAERIVHFLAQRGEFGEGDPEYLAAWWLDPERLAQTEHRRPDGTVLGLNCHRLADGS